MEVCPMEAWGWEMGSSWLGDGEHGKGGERGKKGRRGFGGVRGLTAYLRCNGDGKVCVDDKEDKPPVLTTITPPASFFPSLDSASATPAARTARAATPPAASELPRSPSHSPTSPGRLLPHPSLPLGPLAPLLSHPSLQAPTQYHHRCVTQIPGQSKILRRAPRLLLGIGSPSQSLGHQSSSFVEVSFSFCHPLLLPLKPLPNLPHPLLRCLCRPLHLLRLLPLSQSRSHPPPPPSPAVTPSSSATNQAENSPVSLFNSHPPAHFDYHSTPPPPLLPPPPPPERPDSDPIPPPAALLRASWVATR
ncbi:unnamed protein product [Closterium sp. NIES-54]